MDNRRNYYRILHVQPEAPTEIIKASYRALMLSLKQHPDLGGSHKQAALINHAYSVLSNPVRRAQYDARTGLNQRARIGREGAETKQASNEGQSASARTSNRQQRAKAGKGFRRECVFCGQVQATGSDTRSRCTRCQSPLTPIDSLDRNRIGELFGRRRAPRRTSGASVRLFPQWPHAGIPARLLDFSPVGFRIIAPYCPAAGQVIRVQSRQVHALAQVVATQKKAEEHMIHAELISIEALKPVRQTERATSKSPGQIS